MVKPKIKLAAKPKHAGGRPTDYSQELIDEICFYLSQGKSLRTVCAMETMPSMPTIFEWLRKHEQFSKQYAQAKQESADAMAEEVMDLADDSTALAQMSDPKSASAIVQSMKLRVDARRWLMSKMKPKKYGEKLDVTSDGKVLPTPIYSGQSTKGV